MRLSLMVVGFHGRTHVEIILQVIRDRNPSGPPTDNDDVLLIRFHAGAYPLPNHSLGCTLASFGKSLVSSRGSLNRVSVLTSATSVTVVRAA